MKPNGTVPYFPNSLLGSGLRGQKEKVNPLLEYSAEQWKSQLEININGTPFRIHLSYFLFLYAKEIASQLNSNELIGFNVIKKDIL